ncbi:MAG: type IV toxin-antitoxin system AbiEi family antitoxin domain-containing protein [Marmoricola sp.]|nr:type IV toxin-antitoxin system AbiEi family antitoxin domain-containing protein [Marmoricola sp.]
MDTPHDPQLRLDPLVARLPLDRPFTPRQASGVGVPRSSLERLVRAGQVRRVLRGVYAPATAPDDTTFRARALALAVGGTPVAVDRTAGWVHGLALPAMGVTDDQPPLDLARTQRRSRGSVRSLAAREIVCLEGLRVTTPLRTALDLGRLLPPGAALTCLDRLVGRGQVAQTDLVAELPRMAGLPGIGQLRTLVAQTDGRACCAPESVLRLHWNAARLPTAIPALPVVAGGRLVRLSIGTEHRDFGAVLAGHVDADDLHALQGAGWWIVVLPERRVLEVQPETLTKHLEREYHQHLLARVEAAG